jgi:hypothetical protein
MNIALITVVNPQDNDIFDDMLLYYYNLGIRNYYIMLHKSDIILRNHVFLLETMYDVSVKTFFNESEQHWHEKDCKVLTDAAVKDGMEWIIGSDADELLVIKNGMSLESFLNQYIFPYGSLHFKWFEYRAISDVNEKAFINMQYREKEPRQQTKSIGIFNEKMAYVPGLHYIADSPEVINVDPEQAFYAHFSDRNEKQYVDKMTLQAKNWNQRYGKYSHWAEKLIEEDPHGLKNLWMTMLNQNKDKEIIHDPINPELFKI